MNLYHHPLECGHAFVVDGVPAKADDVVWCRTCDAPAVVTARGQRLKESRKKVKAGA